MRLGFIGAGKMARAIARGALAAKLCDAEEVSASAPSEASREKFLHALGGNQGARAFVTNENAEVARRSDIVFFCTKPAKVIPALRELAGSLSGKLVVSIATGVKLNDLQAAAGLGTPVIRVMPNTPVVVRQGCCVFAKGTGASDADAETVATIFGALGDVHQIEERLIDAATGVSGSGPAYIYLVIEALADGGVMMGLPRPLAASLAAKTVLGAGAMVCETGEHPATLREAVTSPGGTTIAALDVLEQNAVRSAFMSAVRAAAERAAEMG